MEANMPTSSDSIGQLAGALAKAQAELVNPPKSLTAVLHGGPGRETQRYRYAPLSTGLTIVRKTLGRHELAVVQTTDRDPATGAVELTTTLVHGSGEWISTRWPVCPSETCGDPKLMGAALTYARRYSLFALVGLAAEDDLDAPELKRPAPRADADGQADLTMGPVTAARPAAPRFHPRRAFPLSRAGERVRGKVDGVTRAAPAPVDPLAALARIDSEDALVRWAIAALPHRSGLDDEPRAALDEAFRARAAAIGASPDLVLAFAENAPAGEGSLPVAPPDSGDDHAPHAPV
jgi:ERF superfamily